MKQVYLHKYGSWSDMIAECDLFMLASDVDGLNVYVLKDGSEIVRTIDNA